MAAASWLPVPGTILMAATVKNKDGKDVTAKAREEDAEAREKTDKQK